MTKELPSPALRETQAVQSVIRFNLPGVRRHQAQYFDPEVSAELVKPSTGQILKAPISGLPTESL
jgi:hypothetical protein